MYTVTNAARIKSGSFASEAWNAWAAPEKRPLMLAGRPLPLAEGVVQRVVDHQGRDAQPGGHGAVDRQRGLQSAVLLVGVDVDQAGHLPQFLQHLGSPLIQIFQVVSLQGELILGTAR